MSILAEFVRPLYGVFDELSEGVAPPHPDGCRRLVEYAASENGVKGVMEIGDAKTVGLTLRIIPGKAVWYVRRREVTIRLGEAQYVPLEDARYYAEQIRLAAGRGVDLKEFAKVLANFVPGRHPPNSFDMQRIVEHGIAQREKAKLLPESPTWTWAALTDRFLQHKLPKLKEKYRKQYEHYLRLPEFGPLRGKMVAELKLRELEKVRDAIFVAHAPSAVHRALTQSKRMLSWAWRFEATKAGLDDVEHEWWSRWSFEYKTQARTHEPTIQEIARVQLPKPSGTWRTESTKPIRARWEPYGVSP